MGPKDPWVMAMGPSRVRVRVESLRFELDSDSAGYPMGPLMGTHYPPSPEWVRVGPIIMGTQSHV
jgi:hypothetical protein